MHQFDYSYLSTKLIPANLLNVAEAISELRILAAGRKEQYAHIFSGLEGVARIQSVKGSNAIEGIVTSDERLREIVNRSSAPLNHSEMEIAGYRDALNLIHENHGYLDVREEDILQLHRIMLSYTPEGGGKYKTADNVILEIDTAGRRSIRFSPTPAAETSEAMNQLVLAYQDARNKIGISQLLLIPCFILDFLCIHPFADGNGRMSRLLSLLLLYKAGFDIVKFISFEELINSGKAGYYQALKDASIGWHTNQNRCLPFIENFLMTLLRCYKELDQRFALVNGKRVSKQNRIEATVLNSLLPISKQEIASILPDVSVTTIEAVLARMLKAGQIDKIGSARNIKYHKRH